MDVSLIPALVHVLNFTKREQVYKTIFFKSTNDETSDYFGTLFRGTIRTLVYFNISL